MFSQYTKLPSSPDDKSQKSTSSLGCLRCLYRPRVFFIIVLVVIGGTLVVLFQLFKGHNESSVQIEPHTPNADQEKQPDTITTISAPFHSSPQSQWIKSFDAETRPSWMDLPLPLEPLAFRVAVMSHPSEVERRQLIRDNIFKGVRPSEIDLKYCFVLGLPDNVPAERKMDTLRKEQEKHGDLEVMDIDDARDRLSQKRYHALKWAEAFSNTSYDYFMTIDSDTFVRFGALARRLPTVLEGKNIDPRKDATMVARMGSHWWYWLGTVSDENKESTEEDLRLDGPWYPYPIGIGYMLSSYLVKQFLSAKPPLPHHIAYPCDDVMIGSWISSLNVFADPQHTFRVSKRNDWNIDVGIRPDPLLPEPVNTIVVDDHGWHDYKGRPSVEEYGGPIGWDSVCIHHVRESEIKSLREIEELQGEWD